MTHSKKFSVVKRWYAMGMWSIDRVKNAVVMKYITEEEFKEITGEVYA